MLWWSISRNEKSAGSPYQSVFREGLGNWSCGKTGRNCGNRRKIEVYSKVTQCVIFQVQIF